jgi:hypothetical protein
VGERVRASGSQSPPLSPPRVGPAGQPARHSGGRPVVIRRRLSGACQFQLVAAYPVYLLRFEGGMINFLEEIVAFLTVKCALLPQASSAKKGTARTSGRKGTQE